MLHTTYDLLGVVQCTVHFKKGLGGYRAPDVGGIQYYLYNKLIKR